MTLLGLNGGLGLKLVYMYLYIFSDFSVIFNVFMFSSTVAMETMPFLIVQKSLALKKKNLCISGVPMNDLAPMKNCHGGCKVGQISSRGIL